MLMNKDEFESRVTDLKKLYFQYSIKVRNYYRLGIDDVALLDYLMKQIDVILDWYNDLLKEKMS